MASIDDRIKAIGQDIYYARHEQQNDVIGTDLSTFLDETVLALNQFLPELEKEADWNFVRTNDNTSIGIISATTTISYPLPSSIRKLIAHPMRDLTIQQGGIVISTFKVVNPNQPLDPNDRSLSNRVTVLRRKLIFSRPLNLTELSGTIVADTIAPMPRMSRTDSDLLDLLDTYLDIRQLIVLGIVKNQILSDIVQGGLAPAFTTKYASLLKECVAENNASAAADLADAESFGFIGMVGM